MVKAMGNLCLPILLGLLLLKITSTISIHPIVCHCKVDLLQANVLSLVMLYGIKIFKEMTAPSPSFVL